MDVGYKEIALERGTRVHQEIEAGFKLLDNPIDLISCNGLDFGDIVELKWYGKEYYGVVFDAKPYDEIGVFYDHGINVHTGVLPWNGTYEECNEFLRLIGTSDIVSESSGVDAVSKLVVPIFEVLKARDKPSVVKKEFPELRPVSNLRIGTSYIATKTTWKNEAYLILTCIEYKGLCRLSTCGGFFAIHDINKYNIAELGMTARNQNKDSVKFAEAKFKKWYPDKKLYT